MIPVSKGQGFPPFIVSWSPVNSQHKGQWRGALMFFFIYAWINSWVNKGEADDLRGYRAHYDATVMTVTVMTVSMNQVTTRPCSCFIVEQIIAYVRRIVQIMTQATDLEQILYRGNPSRKKRGLHKISIWPPFSNMAATGYPKVLFFALKGQ